MVKLIQSFYSPSLDFLSFLLCVWVELHSVHCQDNASLNHKRADSHDQSCLLPNLYPGIEGMSSPRSTNKNPALLPDWNILEPGTV